MSDTRFDALWKNQRFTSWFRNITIDEAHCVSEWGDGFRPEYGEIGRLRWIIPRHVTFHATSATMPPHVLRDVQKKLHIDPHSSVKIHRANDRPNIHLMVVEMIYPAKTKYDLIRALGLDRNSRPPPFMVFDNTRVQAECSWEAIQLGLPAEFREKVVWFHSGMSSEFRAEKIEKLRSGELWGICCTDAAGMVSTD